MGSRNGYAVVHRHMSYRVGREPRLSVRPHERAPHNLPAPSTPLIGRDTEREQLHSLLQQWRLVTLVGPGGCGKSALTLEVVRRLLDDYTDGVWLTDLSSLHEPQLIWQSLAAALQLEPPAGTSVADSVIDFASSAHMLVVLDHCEHLVDMCARIADRMLAACPRLRLMACSQEALNIAGEFVWLVTPLLFPSDPARIPADELARYSAVELFVARAQAAGARFQRSPDSLLAAAEICRRLDGIPLAIELAAATAAGMSTSELLRYFDDRLELLKSGRRTAHRRHQTLRGAIDWSYELLSHEEQRLFQRLAVFNGGFIREDAEQVCEDEVLSRLDVRQLLPRLVAKSMVAIATESGRYTVLETIRLYAKERLEASGEEVKLSDRHLERYLQIASEGEYTGPNAAATLDRLETETGNLRGALAWGLSRRDPRALTLAMALSQFWDVRGRLEEGRGWLQQAAAATAEDRADHLEGLVTLAWLVLRQGDLRAVRDTLEHALELQRRLHHREVAPRLYDNLGMVSLFDGDLEQASAQFRQSFVTATELGDEPGMSSALFHLALSAYFAGDREAAERQAAEALELRRTVGQPVGVAYCEGLLASLALDRGDSESARELMAGAMLLMAEWGDQVDAAFGLDLCARLAASDGKPRRALLLASAAEGLRLAAGAANLRLWRHINEPALAAAAQAIGPREAEVVRARGTSFTLGDAVRVARDPGLGEEQSSSGLAQLLSAREAEIAELVAEGYSSKEIGRRLFIATRTAETHVQNIFNKLGFSSRAQIAAWVVERRLSHPG